MCDECAPWAYCKHLFRSRPLTDEHPTPWSVKTHENRFSGTEYIVVDANGKYVAEATEQYIARLIARGQFNVIPQPEEPIYKRVRRLETELAEAKAAMKAENEKTFREADQRLKKCGEKESNTSSSSESGRKTYLLMGRWRRSASTSVIAAPG